MNTDALTNPNKEQLEIQKLLQNYSEKKKFYTLTKEEERYLEKLKYENEKRKNPTWIGSIVNTFFTYITGQVQNTRLETLYLQYNPKEKFLQEYEEIMKENETNIQIYSNAGVIQKNLLDINPLESFKRD